MWIFEFDKKKFKINIYISFQDSTGHIGFQFKEGKINSIAVDSSAARNGLLVDHNLLEVDIYGLRDVKIDS